MELVQNTTPKQKDKKDLTPDTPPNSMDEPCYSPYSPGPSPTGVPKYIPTYNPIVSPVSPDYRPTDPDTTPPKEGTSQAPTVSTTPNEDDSDEIKISYEMYTIDKETTTKTPTKKPYE